jgi:afadin
MKMSSTSSQWIDLVTLVNEWNRRKFDLFSISLPKEENLEFNGIMRFYYQEESKKVLSKCIRVTSKASTENLILILCEKFIRIRKEAIHAKDYSIYEFFSETGNKLFLFIKVLT